MDTISTFTRDFLAVYFLLIGLYYSSRSYALSERTGVSHIHYGQRWSLTWFYRQLFNGFRAAILLVCVFRVPFDIDGWLGGWEALQHPILMIPGIILLLVAYVIIMYVQAYMHQDWRSGVSPPDGHTLVTSGPFSRSRNPLFIGILLGQLGFFLAFVSIFSLLCLAVGVVVIMLQVRAEERALEAEFDIAYRQYCAKVPRWL